MRHRHGKKLGVYIETYHQSRPHQALFNFTPAHVHELNNKSALLAELNATQKKDPKKTQSLLGRTSKQISQQADEGGCPGKGRGEIVDPGANTKPFFTTNNRILKMRIPKRNNDSLHSFDFCLI